MSGVGRWALIVVTVAGLAIDAYVHFDLASGFDSINTSTLSQGDLFRAEAIIAIVVAVALVVRPRWYTAALAFLTAGGGAVLLAVYRYVDISAFGPIPAMYEPVWYAEKTATFVAQIVAALTALALIGATRGRSARPSPSPA